MRDKKLYNLGTSDFMRYVACIMLLLCALPLCAQNNTAKLLNDVLMSKDVNACKNLLKQITEEEVSQMADSTLRDYYYLAAWNASEENRLEESICYLVRIKDLCENKLGINNNVLIYFEVINVIGETYEELGKNEEALLWYEEGLVKALPYFNSKNETLNFYIRAIRDNAANLFEKRGASGMVHYLRSEKPLDYEGSFDYACDLLDQAIALYGEGKGQEAIALLDQAYKIFRKCGEKGQSMMQPLYRYYLFSYANVGDTRRIDKLLKSKKRLMFQREEGSYLVSDMGEVIAIFLLNHYNIKAAQKYYQYILKEYNKSDQNEADAIEHLGKNLQYFTQVYAQIDSLEQIRQLCTAKDYAWGKTSLLLANLMIKIQRYEDGNRICEEIYPVSSQLRADPDNLHWAILMNLADYNLTKKNESAAERYLKEQQKWLDAHGFSSNDVEYGWIYNKMGILYINSGRYEESGKMLMMAEEIILKVYSRESLEYATILHNKGRLAQLQGNYGEAKKILDEAQRLQMALDGKLNEKTEQYLNEVEHAIQVQL